MKKHYFIFAAAFFFALGSNILGFSLIFRLTDLFSFTPGRIGIFIAFGQLAFFLGANLYHRFGAAFDPDRVFPVAALMAFTASIPLSFIPVEAVAYVSYWILMMGGGLFWPPVMAWLTAGLDNNDMNREMGIFNRCWMGALMVGPLIAGGLYRWNSTLNFLILIFSYFLVNLLIYLMRLYSKKTAGSKTARTRSPDHGSINTARTMNVKLDFYRYRGWANGFFSSVFISVLVNIIPLHIRDGLGHTEQSAGIMLFIRCAAGFVGFSVLAKFTAWHFNRFWFMVLQAGLILCTFFFMFAGDSLMFYYIIVVFYGFINAACYNNSMFYSSVTGNNPKKNLAAHEIFLCLGSAAGTTGGGFAYQHFGFAGACIFFVMILALGMALLVYFDRKARVYP